MKRVTHVAHDLIRSVVKPGDVVIDATAGNGHDTLFLTSVVGEEGRVHAFDVQYEALLSTRERLAVQNATGPVSYHLASHARIARHVSSASAVMFNLGYLPGTDQVTITQTDSTVEALQQAAEVLTPGGIITCICYPGHPGGLEEAEAVLDWARIHAEFSKVTLPDEKDRLEGRPFLVGFENRPAD
ncbi:class I SAM-dependent methyltransferase [Akkermansiaceae bacterium]|nr:class I SAM-dependent methyltransferase [Akkermansiaceae bacterium]MDA7936029.1 class I SAM-dependent methyltransferase [bacterium]MDA7931765.1 class I SAM-dependent methyltransferase [Akkermansiaceae bacterium]MDB4143661.1 class I SAM-dependent methyltransferase [Akkermansiaceae bacterium]MDB4296745.1 class I SAM-dependent methyltransferase [Akkermansiaceae bacterium]